MKQSLHLRLGQQVTMTPQLQQAIRLLQLPAAELNLEIREALESNLMLEADEEAEPAVDSPAETSDEGFDAQRDPSEALLGSDATDAARLGEDFALDERWDEAIASRNPSSPSEDYATLDTLENHAADAPSLQAHLHWQLQLSTLSERDQRIAAALIDSIDDDGHLVNPLEVIPAELAADPDEIKAVLTFIQHLDPLGVAASNAPEALRIQIEALPADTPACAIATTLLREHFESLGHSQHAGLRRALGIDQSQLDAAIALIRTLSPHPGADFSQPRIDYIIPDCIVERANGGWQVDINPQATPGLRVNAAYAGLIQRGDNSADNQLMRQHLQEARWLIKSLESREQTLRKVAECIVERQQAFLEHGEEAMQPLILRDIADAIEMHESTVSRITTQKYMRTPQGTLEFKAFFSSHVPTADGGECSATAIRARIRRLIAAESPARPLSDAHLTDRLQAEGIHVARRTVAKYREGMGIGSSTQRKRPA